MGRRRRKRRKRVEEPVKRSRISLSPTNLPIWVWLIAIAILLIFASGVIVDYFVSQEPDLILTQNNEMIRVGGNLLPADLPISPSP